MANFSYFNGGDILRNSPLLLELSQWQSTFFAPQVEPSTKLFPAVFAKATSPNVFQFELSRMKVSRAQ